MSNIKEIEKLVLADVAADLKQNNVGPDEDLLAHGIIDSLGLMRLVVSLESGFGIKVSDEELLPENFQTLNAIANFVERKRAG